MNAPRGDFCVKDCIIEAAISNTTLAIEMKNNDVDIQLYFIHLNE